MEILQRVHLFADAEQLDRLAGDRAHGERRAAAAVAVDAGEHDAGDADALVEVLGEIDRVLAGQRVGDQQDLVRPGGVADLRHLGHQRLVDMGAARRCRDDDVIALRARRRFRRGCAIATGSSPATIGSVSTPTWRPSTASCSCAAGRLTSSEAIRTLALLRSVRRLAIWRRWWSCRRLAGRPA